MAPCGDARRFQGVTQRNKSLDWIEAVRGHQAELWRYARVLGCSSEEAADATQEAFLVAIRKSSLPDDSEAQRVYLRRTLRFFVLGQLRAKGRRPQLDPDAVEAAWVALPDGGSGARIEALRVCLDELGPRARQALEERQRGRPRAAIGEELGLGLEATRSLLRRTRELLRRCVEGRLSDE